MSQHEQMAQMFDAIDGDGRRYVLAVLRGEFDRVQRTQRPALQLVDNDLTADRAPAATARRPALAIVAAGRRA